MIKIETPNPNESIYVKDINKVPINNKSGVYMFYGKNDELLYIGIAKNLINRIKSHISGNTNTYKFYKEFHRVELFYIQNGMERDILETYLINSLSPKYNKDKVYSASDKLNDIKLDIKINTDNNVQIKRLFIEKDEWRYITKEHKRTLGIDRQKEKLKLLREFKKVIGEKYDRLNDKTKKAFEQIAFLSSDRGLLFASVEYISTKCDINSATIRRYFSEFKKAGIVNVMYTRHKTHNGRGNAIYIFKSHCQYPFWDTYFK